MPIPGSHIVKTRDQREAWLVVAIGWPSLTIGERIIAAALYTHHNLKTGQLNPSLARLARMTRQTERQAQRAIKALRAAGLLDWTSGPGRKSNDYTLILVPTDESRLDGHDANAQSVQEDVIPTPVSRQGSPIPTDARSYPDSTRSLSRPGSPTNLVNRENHADALALAAARERIGEQDWSRYFKKLTVEGSTLTLPAFQFDRLPNKCTEALSECGLTAVPSKAA